MWGDYLSKKESFNEGEIRAYREKMCFSLNLKESQEAHECSVEVDSKDGEHNG